MRFRTLVAAALAAATLGSCGSDGAAGRAREEILVFAAASLTEVFGDIREGFEAAHPSVTVRFNFGPSDGLATGITNGGAADVFASASPKWMDAVASSPGIVDRADFATNRLAVILPKDNPARIGTFADLAKPRVKLVLAAATVPAGTYAREALAKAGLEAAVRNVVSNEEDVKSVVQKVVLGEADAGIVYRTDVTARVAGSVAVVEIPDAVNVVARYPIAAIRTGDHLATSRAFVAYVVGDGRTVLTAAGFGAP